MCPDLSDSASKQSCSACNVELIPIMSPTIGWTGYFVCPRCHVRSVSLQYNPWARIAYNIMRDFKARGLDTFDMRRISDHLTEDVTKEIVRRAEMEKAEDARRTVSDQMDRLCPGSVD